MRKALAGLCLAACLAGPLAGAPEAAAAAGATGVTAPVAAAPAPPTILLDSLPLPFPVPPTIVNDRVMVPFRAIAEALGVTVTWIQETRSVDARGFGKQVLLTVDSPVAIVDEKAQPLSVPPIIRNERTLVPLRFFSEVFGAEVDWLGETRTVTIRSPVRPMRTMAFYAIRSFNERELLSRFSDVAFGWAVLTPDGRVDTAGDPDYRWPEAADEATPEGLMLQAAFAGTRRHLMVHALDDKGQFTEMILDPARRSRAAAELEQTVVARGFQGVVLDMEYLGQTETGAELERIRAGFSALVREVAQRLRPLGRATIVSVHPPNGAFRGYDYKAIGAAADFLQLMAHDYLDRRTAEGPEPAGLVIEAIEQTLQQVGREKVLLGIVAPYETPDSFGQKAGLAKRYGLAGLTVWRLGTVGADRMAALERSVSPQK